MVTLVKLLAVALAVTVGLVVPAARSARPTDAPPTVAAASDLQFALEEIASAFRKDTGRNLKLVFGSSGNFARQIAQGAPFQIFFSADESFVRQLVEQGRTVDGGLPYAIGRVVLFAGKGSPLNVDANVDGLRSALASGQIQRFAIANPEHAPYGRAAEQVLRSQGLWDAMRSKLVLGENVSQAAQFAATGSAQGGIFAYSLALAPQVSERGTYVLLPAEWHSPLRQQMVLLKGVGPTARAFFEYVQQPSTRAIFRKYGFVLPGEG